MTSWLSLFPSLSNGFLPRLLHSVTRWWPKCWTYSLPCGLSSVFIMALSVSFPPTSTPWFGVKDVCGWDSAPLGLGLHHHCSLQRGGGRGQLITDHVLCKPELGTQDSLLPLLFPPFLRLGFK